MATAAADVRTRDAHAVHYYARYVHGGGPLRGRHGISPRPRAPGRLHPQCTHHAAAAGITAGAQGRRRPATPTSAAARAAYPALHAANADLNWPKPLHTVDTAWLPSVSSAFHGAGGTRGTAGGGRRSNRAAGPSEAAQARVRARLEAAALSFTRSGEFVIMLINKHIMRMALRKLGSRAKRRARARGTTAPTLRWVADALRRTRAWRRWVAAASRRRALPPRSVLLRFCKRGALVRLVAGLVADARQRERMVMAAGWQAGSSWRKWARYGAAFGAAVRARARDAALQSSARSGGRKVRPRPKGARGQPPPQPQQPRQQRDFEAGVAGAAVQAWARRAAWGRAREVARARQSDAAARHRLRRAWHFFNARAGPAAARARAERGQAAGGADQIASPPRHGRQSFGGWRGKPPPRPRSPGAARRATRRHALHALHAAAAMRATGDARSWRARGHVLRRALAAVAAGALAERATRARKRAADMCRQRAALLALRATLETSFGRGSPAAVSALARLTRWRRMLAGLRALGRAAAVGDAAEGRWRGVALLLRARAERRLRAALLSWHAARQLGAVASALHALRTVRLLSRWRARNLRSRELEAWLAARRAWHARRRGMRAFASAWKLAG